MRIAITALIPILKQLVSGQGQPTSKGILFSKGPALNTGSFFFRCGHRTTARFRVDVSVCVCVCSC